MKSDRENEIYGSPLKVMSDMRKFQHYISGDILSLQFRVRTFFIGD